MPRRTRSRARQSPRERNRPPASVPARQPLNERTAAARPVPGPGEPEPPAARPPAPAPAHAQPEPPAARTSGGVPAPATPGGVPAPASDPASGDSPPRIVEEHHFVDSYGQDEIEAVDDLGRRWFSFRPRQPRSYDLVGFGLFWWTALLLIAIGLAVWGWGWGWAT